MSLQFFSFAQRAEGVIAIGQEATGIIAIGQFATGVVAIGQVARGGIAIGQLAFGVVALGMLSIGLVYSVGMIGAGGRAGYGGILPLVPTPPRRAKLPALASPEAIRAGRETGWLPVRLRKGDTGLVIEHGGALLSASIAPGCAEGANTASGLGVEVLGLFGPGGAGPELKRLMRIQDGTLFEGGLRILAGAAQLALLAVVCVAYWEWVAIDLGDFVVSSLRELFTGT